MHRFSRSFWKIGFVVALLGWPATVTAEASPPKSASVQGEGKPPSPEATEREADGGDWTTDPSPPGKPKESAARKEPEPSPGGEGQVASEAKAPMDGATYRIRLRDLEQRVDELKEQIRRSHTRLSLLSDTILAGGVGGARAEIEFVNDLSGAFKIVEAVFVLDGAVQYRKQDESGSLAEQETIPIFSGTIPSGDHTLQVLLKLRGHGFGVFSYLRGYLFELRDTHSFTVTDGKVIEIKAVAWEKGGATTPMEERPTMRYTTRLRSLGELPRGASEPARDPGTTGTSKAGSGGVSVGGGK